MQVRVLGQRCRVAWHKPPDGLFKYDPFDLFRNAWDQIFRLNHRCSIFTASIASDNPTDGGYEEE
jgi:hypothetical protein